MTSPARCFLAAALLVSGSSVMAAAPRDAQSAQKPDLPPRPDLVREPYSDADVNFMSGMIPHHAQAVLIAGWAASHGARADVRILCERIVVGQRDEIATMRRWLQDHGEAVPDSNATRAHMVMGGMSHDMLMPGMLSDVQLAQLDSARGAAWDRLFLQDMIQHQRGAIAMVDQLFTSYGAAQDEVVFRFASD